MRDNDRDRDDRERVEQARHRRDDERVGRLNVVSVFDRLGYDLYNNTDVQRLAENLRFAEQQRRRAEAISGNKAAWMVSLALVFVGSAMTALISWVLRR